MAKVTWSAGIDSVSGALSKPGKGQHSCKKMLLGTHRVAETTSNNCNRIYLRPRVERAAQPGANEVQNRVRFATIATMVANRRQNLATITTDQQNFFAQKNSANGKKTLLSYLWKVCKEEYEANNQG